MRQYLQIVLSFIIPAIAAVCISQDSQIAHVKRIIDADTIVVHTGQDEVTVRLIGIDCPESRPNSKCKRDGKQGWRGCDWQVPRGKRAKKRAEKLLEAESVTLECDEKCEAGAYGRQLRYVRLPGGRDYGIELVKEGLCQDFSFKYPHPREESYQKAQLRAKKQKKGIWK